MDAVTANYDPACKRRVSWFCKRCVEGLLLYAEKCGKWGWDAGIHGHCGGQEWGINTRGAGAAAE